MELLFFWLMFAITAAVIGSAKGRSGFGWFILGLPFGIFAVLIVACLPSLKAPVAYKVVAADGSVSLMQPVLPDRQKVDPVAVAVVAAVVAGVWVITTAIGG